MKILFLQPLVLLFCLASANGTLAQNGGILLKTNDYELRTDGVKQGKFSAKALSATELTSDYESPKNTFVSSKIVFKFSINGKDNEMKAGVNHVFNLSADETPLVGFGVPLKEMPNDKETAVKPDTPLKIRLDLRKAINEIKTKGYFTTFNGDKIFKDDFKKVYVAGATAPLSWDFDNLHQKPELEMKDPDGDGIYETTLMFNAKKDQKQTAQSWKLSKNIVAFPQYKSDHVISDALYSLSLEEMANAVEPDSTFRTGKEWAGVWTRDISYSIILSMAYLQPKVAMNSLMRKVSASKRIIQDTGTGGAYPCSTDRMVWAIAAWEVYKATGDRKWLESSFAIVQNSINDDYENAYDHETGLVRGESSFLDWREQTYPKWMQPADIFESENLGTNAVHYQANVVLADMARILNRKDIADKHLAYADKIKTGINTYLWMSDKGYYAQYLYGRNFKIASPRAEALGEALCVLFGIADAEKCQSIVEKTPVTAYGISCIYPQIPNIPPYHNDAVWPFVQSYWALASAKSGNETSVLESIGAINRPAALFLTNKENFVARNGDFAGTEINSGNMLWSLSGSLALVHKVLFGIEFEADKIVFHPFVPQALGGNRMLSNFKYREAVLDISLEGFGNKIKSFTVDGKTAKPEILATVKGKHVIKIVLENNVHPSEINKRKNYFSLPAPEISVKDRTISWAKTDRAVVYQILRNGKVYTQTTATSIDFKPHSFQQFQVIAVDENGVTSFASEPVNSVEPGFETIYEAESVLPKASLPYKGFSGNGFVETSKTANRTMTFTVDIDEPGMYAIDFRYANGNGPTNTENKCAIRSLENKDKTQIGTFVFPQRGVQEWSNWGFSNSVEIYLEKGQHQLVLAFNEANENMNGAINQAMIDYLRVTEIRF